MDFNYKIVARDSIKKSLTPKGVRQTKTKFIIRLFLNHNLLCRGAFAD